MHVTNFFIRGQKYLADIQMLVSHFRFFFFIVATDCPSERQPRKTVSCYGDKIQDETTEFFKALGV